MIKVHQGLITDFKQKAEPFNSFFPKQCSIIDNSSKFPSNLVNHTNEKCSGIVLNSEDIGNIISGLDPNKAQGHDMVSIRMLKMCGESIRKYLKPVIFSPKIKKPLYTPLNLNDTNVKQTAFQKHLGLILDSQLSFGEHLKTIFNKVNKTIGLIRKLRNSLPTPCLITLSFIRPHLDYGDII